MAANNHLLVPMNLEALVIDQSVIDQSNNHRPRGGFEKIGDGRWYPYGSNYSNVSNDEGGDYLANPSIPTFLGAKVKGENFVWPADSWQQALAGKSRADRITASKKFTGVYLHWIVPDALRHAYDASKSIDFPPLPDQWLVVRYARHTDTGKVDDPKAWFVDGGLINTDASSGDTPAPPPDSASLLLPGTDGDTWFTGQAVGKSVEIGSFDPTHFSGPRTQTTAVGNGVTGSLTFTGLVADNRNVLSFRDDLADLVDANNKIKFPKIALTYQVIGWYKNASDDPLTFLKSKLKTATAAELLKEMDWQMDSPPANFTGWTCLFHSMVAHVNFWNPDVYKGRLLGYPGAPYVHGGTAHGDLPVKVGVGGSATDALIALAAQNTFPTVDQLDADTTKEMWKVLEALIYRQATSLLQSWQEAPREYKVQRDGFKAHTSGKTWSAASRERNPNDLGLGVGDGSHPLKESQHQDLPPIPAAAKTLLEALNTKQAGIDRLLRKIVSWQQEFYARWWTLSKNSQADLEEGAQDQANCAYFKNKITAALAKLPPTHPLHPYMHVLSTLTGGSLQALINDLNVQSGWKLQSAAAPRFYGPSDPVIAVHNAGKSVKHDFPNDAPKKYDDPTTARTTMWAGSNVTSLLPCRPVTAVATSSSVTASLDKAKTANAAAFMTRHFSAVSGGVNSLLTEGAFVEGTISDLVKSTLSAAFTEHADWENWLKRIYQDLTWVAPNHAVNIREKVTFNSGAICPNQLVGFWGKQPWSPLYLDWQITWHPANVSNNFATGWNFAGYDYRPKTAAGSKGYPLTGRSLMLPVGGRHFTDPLDELAQLLQGHGKTGDEIEEDGKKRAFDPNLVDLLHSLQGTFLESVQDLEKGGLIGQAITGFHQRLMLKRDMFLPRVQPFGKSYNWNQADPATYTDALANGLLQRRSVQFGNSGEFHSESLHLPGLAPPSQDHTHEPDFSLIRAGSFTIDHLWIIDDFGQSLDVFEGSSQQGGADGYYVSPHLKQPGENLKTQRYGHVTLPPRIVQPSRLHFRFTENPVCGWVFYNYLDQALAICDTDGKLLGELALIEPTHGTYSLRWECLKSNTPYSTPIATVVKDPTMLAFANRLNSSAQNLADLLKLMDSALEHIRPVGSLPYRHLFGRPLALVKAELGLELFGEAWTDPGKAVPSSVRGATGNAALDALSLPVELGLQGFPQDGLVGYYKGASGAAMGKIIPSGFADDTALAGSTYVDTTLNDRIHVKFFDPDNADVTKRAPSPITMLVDPYGSIHATVGILPAKSVTLPVKEVREAISKMEHSYRIDPILCRRAGHYDAKTKKMMYRDHLSVALPTGKAGSWEFHGPQLGSKPVIPEAIHAKPSLGNTSGVTKGGRLVLRQKKVK